MIIVSKPKISCNIVCIKKINIAQGWSGLLLAKYPSGSSSQPTGTAPLHNMYTSFERRVSRLVSTWALSQKIFSVHTMTCGCKCKNQQGCMVKHCIQRKCSIHVAYNENAVKHVACIEYSQQAFVVIRECAV